MQGPSAEVEPWGQTGRVAGSTLLVKYMAPTYSRQEGRLALSTQVGPPRFAAPRPRFAPMGIHTLEPEPEASTARGSALLLTPFQSSWVGQAEFGPQRRPPPEPCGPSLSHLTLWVWLSEGVEGIPSCRGSLPS